jgi:hypothetical protein
MFFNVPIFPLLLKYAFIFLHTGHLPNFSIGEPGDELDGNPYPPFLKKAVFKNMDCPLGLSDNLFNFDR